MLKPDVFHIFARPHPLFHSNASEIQRPEFQIIRVGDRPFTGGLILFPLVALFGDVLTEVYGYAESRKVIWTGLTSLILLVLMVWIAADLHPGHPAPSCATLSRLGPFGRAPNND